MTLGDKVAIGKGSSKKEAKAKAASEMLRMLSPRTSTPALTAPNSMLKSGITSTDASAYSIILLFVNEQSNFFPATDL